MSRDPAENQSADTPSPSGRTILHADLDCFFAAAEVLDEPSLRGKPVVVGGSPNGRGVVAAASYEAREYGVRSAMPMARAVRLCPQVIIRRGRMERYSELSKAVFAVFHRYTPQVEPISIDEAFLDVTESVNLFGDGPTIARRIREEVRDEIGLVVSIGVAASKFVAKLASPMNKPDGLTIAPSDPIALREWLAPTPVGRMWGIGPRTEPRLVTLGYRTFADLQQAAPDVLRRDLGEHALAWQQRALGHDVREVRALRDPARTVGHETTFAEDIADHETLRVVISQLSDKVASRARKKAYEGHRVSVKLRYADFTTITRQTSMKHPIQEADSIFKAAWGLLVKAVPDGTPLRLVGVTLGSLRQKDSQSRQKTLFDAPAEDAAPAVVARPEGERRESKVIDAALDTIRDKLGPAAIRRGRDMPAQNQVIRDTGTPSDRMDDDDR